LTHLTPAKAAFTQLFCQVWVKPTIKKYWKIPLVYGAIGTSLYFLFRYSVKYHQFRDAKTERVIQMMITLSDNARLISGQNFINVTEICLPYLLLPTL
jgi:hypothetical protein